MSQMQQPIVSAVDLFAAPEPATVFAGLDGLSEAETQAALERIAIRIAETRRPGAQSDIPAGSTYLAQFAVHDLDFRARDTPDHGCLLDLALIYGDGPKHDAFCYQVPLEAGAPRHLLRIGRARPTPSSPAWGAARDLPRAACPHLDARGVETRSEVLVPNAMSDSNLMLGQVQTLWMLLHNAVAGMLAESRTPQAAFDLARRITRGVYRDALRHDLLGTWLMPAFRARYADATPRRLSQAAPGAMPPEFRFGVGRMGHGLVRDIYALNDRMPVVGLRDLVRHTSTGRPHEMPLTEDWLVDFARFFAVGSSQPQRARALGPHVARAMAFGAGAEAGGASADGLVLRDLRACVSGGLRSVPSLIDCAVQAEEGIFDEYFSQDETRRAAVLGAWLTEAGIDVKTADRLAKDPPLTLYLMFEAEADTGGRTLGALGSVLMGEVISAALPEIDAGAEIDAARAAVFEGAAPQTMGETIRFLQRRYDFAEGARLHPPGTEAPATAPRGQDKIGGTTMLDIPTSTTTRRPISRIEVADFVEMGRLVAQWAVDPDTQPKDVAELVDQLDGIATVPDRIKRVEFVQSTLDTLVLRLPVKEMIEESLEIMSNPMGVGRYPLPQFYADNDNPGFGPVMTPLDMLLARVGDYTIAQCR